MIRLNRCRRSTVRATAVSAVVLSAVANLQRVAMAATYTWDASGASPADPTDGSGTWDLSSTRWSNGSSDVAWPNNSSIAVFGNNHGAAGTVTVGSNLAAGGLTFDPPSSGTYKLAGTGTIGLLFSSNVSTIAVAAGTSATISAPIGGGIGTVSVPGPGTLNLAGTNTFDLSSMISVSGGTLNLSSASALGQGDLNVSAGGVVNVLANVSSNYTEPFTQTSINNGNLTIGGGSSLTVSNGYDTPVRFNQSGGTLAVNGSLNVVHSAFTCNGGILANNGTINFNQSQFNYTGGTLSNAGQVNFINSAFYDTAGPLPGATSFVGYASIDTAFPGTFDVVGNSSNAPSVALNSPTGSIPSGVVVIADGTASGNAEPVECSINASSFSGNLLLKANSGYNSSLNLPSGFINQGAITIQNGQGPFTEGAAFTNAVGATFCASNGGQFGETVQLGGVVTNDGNFTADGAFFELYASYGFNQSAGTLTVSDGASLRVTGMNLYGGSVSVAASCTLATSGLNLSGGTINLTADRTSPGTLSLTGLAWPATATATSLSILTATTAPASEGRIDLLANAAANFSLLNPAGTLTISANITDGGLLKSGTGTLLLTGNSTYTGATNVSAGTLVLAAGASLATPSITLQSGTAFNVSGSAAAAAVVVNGGAALRFPAANGSSPAIVHVESLNLASGSTTALGTAAAQADRTLLVINNLVLAGQTNAWTSGLDLGGNDMDVTSGSIATLTNRVCGGYNLAGGGGWNGTTAGIASSAAAADSRHLTAVGVIQNNQSGSPLFTSASPFDGYAPAAGDILLEYTWYGDANLNGKVDGSDYSLIDAGYASQGALTGWYNGDFNYDGVIDGSDYTLIDNAFNNQTVGVTSAALVAAETSQIAGPPAAVPEPAAAGIAVVAAGLLRRRRIACPLSPNSRWSNDRGRSL